MLGFIFDGILEEIFLRLPKPFRIGCVALMIIFLVVLFAWLWLK